MNTTTASSWSLVLETIRGALTQSLFSLFSDRWLNMTPMQMLGEVFQFLNWNPWRVLAALLILAVAHAWYFWDPLRRCGIATGKLALFYAALTLTITTVLWFIDLWTLRSSSS